MSIVACALSTYTSPSKPIFFIGPNIRTFPLPFPCTLPATPSKYFCRNAILKLFTSNLISIESREGVKSPEAFATVSFCPLMKLAPRRTFLFSRSQVENTRASEMVISLSETSFTARFARYTGCLSKLKSFISPVTKPPMLIPFKRTSCIT